MSDTQTITPGDSAHPAAAHGDHHGHDPHVAHHFDSMSQQFDAGKLGMWVFLATEILMFGGLFTAYAVYRANHPQVFAYAHHYLDTTLGGINTIVLIASSLTMAWAVRCAQLGKNRALITCLVLSLLGGLGFLCIKTIEYNHKAHTGKWIGAANMYHPRYKADAPATPDSGHETEKKAPAEKTGQVVAPAPTAGNPDAPAIDRSLLTPPAAGSAGASDTVLEPADAKDGHTAGHKLRYEDLPKSEQERVHIFFQIYYLMTGLHGLHVLIGMALIFWVLVRASRPGDRKWVVPLAPMGLGLFLVYVGLVIHVTAVLIAGVAMAGIFALLAMLRSRGAAVEGDREGDFGPKYFVPVDLVGLYWHLVDLIWIFLFPLLYLIH